MTSTDDSLEAAWRDRAALYDEERALEAEHERLAKSDIQARRSSLERIDAVTDRRFQVEDRIRDARPSLETVAALLVIEANREYEPEMLATYAALLRHVQPGLTGVIAAEVANFLTRVERVITELDQVSPAA
jgi:hypothetical protein